MRFDTSEVRSRHSSPSAGADRIIAVTGASGFVGRALVARLMADRRPVRAIVRRVRPEDGGSAWRVAVGDVGADTRWDAALAGVDTVVHLAARVHLLNDCAVDPLAEYRRVNVEGTRGLALACVRSGVRRLVLVSTVKVHGETTRGRPFTEGDQPAPADPYGVSKMEAEEALHSVARHSPLEAVVIRPPLVYGPGVGANFLALMRAVDRGLPLPLGVVDNRRSLVYVKNLVDALVRCVDHAAAAGHTFLVDDGVPVSTAVLAREIARAFHAPCRLLPIPVSWLRFAGVLTGRRAAIARLLSDLEVDSGSFRRTVGWTAPWTLAQGLTETTAWYLGAAGSRRAPHVYR
ncbi:MAG: SDR family oxidoreductase [Betaproteobacteria bacterium]